MADFQFEVEISAKIQELEQALNKATKSTQEAANKIADAVEKRADPAFENLLKTIGKVRSSSAGLRLEPSPVMARASSRCSTRSRSSVHS